MLQNVLSQGRAVLRAASGSTGGGSQQAGNTQEPEVQEPEDAITVRMKLKMKLGMTLAGNMATIKGKSIKGSPCKTRPTIL